MELRPYQAAAVRELRKRLKCHGRVVLVSPTGSGKTTIAAAFVEARRGRVLWVAHRYELLLQAKRELLAAGVPAADIGILTGPVKENVHARILLASIQIFKGPTPRIPGQGVALIVVDEAHRVQAASYQEVIAACPDDADVLGLTATPERLDGQPLSDTFADMRVAAESLELIADGHIAKPVCYGLPKDKARELVKGLSSDRDYSRVMRSRTLMGDTVKECMRLAPKECTIVFAVDRAHARDLTARFQAEGVSAEYLDNKTPAEERADMLARLAKGTLQVVVNVDVLSEGIDIPAVKCIALCRPTKSITRYLQQVGRGMRMYKRKRPIILDHAGNIWRHGMPHRPRDWSLNGREKDAGRGGEFVWRCTECGEMNDIENAECDACGASRPKTSREIEEHDAELERLEEHNGRMASIRKLAKMRCLDAAWIKEASTT